jgi:cholesterol transport system auxiliary component
MTRLLALVPLLILASCSGLLHSNAPPEQVYFLRAKLTGADAARPANTSSVHVARPVAGPGLDSSHIVLEESARRMSYYVASRWPAPLPEMVEELAAQVLRASGAWSDVQASESPFPSEYLLQIRIRRFDADYTSGSAGRGAAPEVHVALDCTFGRRSGREVIATFVAEGSAVATANRLGDVVAALEDAANTALASLATQAASAAAGAAQKVDKPVASITR